MKSELQASTVDLLQVLTRTMQQFVYGKDAPDYTITPVPRPYVLPDAEPEKAVGLSELTDFLKGQ